MDVLVFLPHLLHRLQSYLKRDELLSQHEQVSHEEEIPVQHAARPTHAVGPHLQSSHTKLHAVVAGEIQRHHRHSSLERGGQGF